MRIFVKYLAALVGSVIVVFVIVGITRAFFNISPGRPDVAPVAELAPPRAVSPPPTAPATPAEPPAAAMTPPPAPAAPPAAEPLEGAPPAGAAPAMGGAPATGGDILMRLAAANPDAGLALRPRCVACHTFEQNGANRVGPNLWNIVGRDKASVPGFQYSEALRNAPGTWTFEELDRFLAAPARHIPGTRMNYAGMPAPGDRANLIAYLRTLSTSPVPLTQ